MARNIEEFVILLNDKVTSKLKKVGAALDGVDNKAKKSQSTFSRLGKLAAGAFAGFQAVQAVKTIANLGIEMEQTRVAFATFTGSAEKGNAVLEKLNQFANVTPFDNKQVIKASKTLLAFGIPAEDLTSTLKFLGDVSAGTGKDLSEMGVIFGQIRSTGKLMGQDLLQLINAGFNPLQEISRKTGESVGSLKEKMSKGAISFEMVEDAFKSATSAGGLFNNMMEKQSATVGGKFSTLLGKLQLIGIAVGEALLPAMGAMVDFGLAIVENIEVLQTVGMAIGVAAAAWAAFNIPVAISIIQIKAITAAQWLWNAAMTANPIGLVIAAIAALTIGIIVLWRHSETFRATMLGLWEVMKVMGDNIGKILIEPLMAIKDIFNGLIDLFSGKGSDRLFDGFRRWGKAILTFLIQPLLQTAKLIDKMAGTNLAGQLKEATGIGDITAGAGAAFGKGFSKEIAKSAGQPEKESALDGLTKAATRTKAAGTGTTDKSNVKAGISEIRSAAPKQINITIEKLVEELNVQSQTLPQSAARIKEEVARALLAAVNDVNVIQG